MTATDNDFWFYFIFVVFDGALDLLIAVGMLRYFLQIQQQQKSFYNNLPTPALMNVTHSVW